MKLISELLKLREAEVIDAADDEEPKKKPKPTKTKTVRPDIDHLGQPKFDQPLSKREPDAPPPDSKSKQTPNQRVSSRDETMRRTSGINPTDDVMQHLSNLHRNMPQNDDDDDVRPEPDEQLPELRRPPETLPKVISHAMKVAGFIEPDWHLVSNLPGNMSRAILQLGKALFASFTTTPTSKITMIGNLNGMGPNTDREIQAVSNYLKKHGTDLGPGDVDFMPVMPGYTADIHNFEADGVHYMLVRDMMGSYIYAWPAHTSLVHKNAARVSHSQKQLTHSPKTVDVEVQIYSDAEDGVPRHLIAGIRKAGEKFGRIKDLEEGHEVVMVVAVPEDKFEEDQTVDDIEGTVYNAIRHTEGVSVTAIQKFNDDED